MDLKQYFIDYPTSTIPPGWNLKYMWHLSEEIKCQVLCPFTYETCIPITEEEFQTKLFYLQGSLQVNVEHSGLMCMVILRVSESKYKSGTIFKINYIRKMEYEKNVQ
jgi:hypothetical protein